MKEENDEISNDMHAFKGRNTHASAAPHHARRMDYHWLLSVLFLGFKHRHVSWPLDSNVAIGCFLLVVGIVFLSWGLYRFVRPAYEVVKKLDGMGEPGTRLVFQIDENGLRIEKKRDGKDVTESFPLRAFQRYIDHPYFLELLDKEKPIVFYTGSLSKKEKMDLIAFLEQAGIRRR